MLLSQYLLPVMAIASFFIKWNQTVAIIWLYRAWCLQKHLCFLNCSIVFIFLRLHPVSLKNFAASFYSGYRGKKSKAKHWNCLERFQQHQFQFVISQNKFQRRLVKRKLAVSYFSWKITNFLPYTSHLAFLNWIFT